MEPLSSKVETAMHESLDPSSLLQVLRDFIVDLVKYDDPDLTARQLSIFLFSYLAQEPQTVRALASRIRVSKPSITRSIDRLEELGLVHRLPDPSDRRSVLIGHTTAGITRFRAMRDALPKKVERVRD